MNKRNIIGIVAGFAAIAAAVIMSDSGCNTPQEPEITPPQPAFVDTTEPPDPVDHRIYADAGRQDAIDIEWKADSSGNTSGYVLYRSIGDSTLGPDGLLKNRTVIAQIESTNELIQPLDTSYVDTTGITPGATYYYQLQAFYRSPTNTLTYSKPTHVDRSTSFTYANRELLLSPNGVDSVHGFPVKFLWQDPNGGGNYQIIVQRLDNDQYVWSFNVSSFGNPVTLEYPFSAPALASAVPYQWRVKCLVPHGGSSSTWMGFTVSP